MAAGLQTQNIRGSTTGASSFSGTTEATEEHLLPVYASMPARPVRGRGSWLMDADGREWLDAYGGHAVASSGHCHPDVVAAIQKQAETLLFYSTAIELPIRETLATRLASLCPAPLSKVFFCNSGAEANENALGLVRKRTNRTKVLAVTGGWHGRTLGALSVTDGAKYEQAAQRGGMPLAQKIPFNDVAALKSAVTDEIAALIVEPVQGVQGARDCSKEFLVAAREATKAAGAALIFDEVQCGAGRCGAFTAAEAYGVVPDVITMAKGLAAGLPIGAVIVSPWVAEGIVTGDLGSTFGGGPVICAAALANLEVMTREGLIENAIQIGDRIRNRLESMGWKCQGKGLLIGVRCPKPAKDVQAALFQQGILTGTSSDPEILRLMPPLNFSQAEADLLLGALEKVVA